jgi:hypothetical protein
MAIVVILFSSFHWLRDLPDRPPRRPASCMPTVRNIRYCSTVPSPRMLAAKPEITRPPILASSYDALPYGRVVIPCDHPFLHDLKYD